MVNKLPSSKDPQEVTVIIRYDLGVFKDRPTDMSGDAIIRHLEKLKGIVSVDKHWCED